MCKIFLRFGIIILVCILILGCVDDLKKLIPMGSSQESQAESSVPAKTDTTPVPEKSDSKAMETLPDPVIEPDLTVIVAKGNTLGQISRKFTGTINNWKEILVYNSINNPQKIKIGGQIKIPSRLLLTQYQNINEPITMSPEKKIIKKETSVSLKQVETDQPAKVEKPATKENSDDLDSIFEEDLDVIFDSAE